MTTFFFYIFTFCKRCLLSLHLIRFELMGYQVNLFSILFVLLFFGFVISIFWRGVKS